MTIAGAQIGIYALRQDRLSPAVEGRRSNPRLGGLTAFGAASVALRATKAD